MGGGREVSPHGGDVSVFFVFFVASSSSWIWPKASCVLGKQGLIKQEVAAGLEDNTDAPLTPTAVFLQDTTAAAHRGPRLTSTFLFTLSAIISCPAKQMFYTESVVFVKDEMCLFIQFSIIFRLRYSIITQTDFTTLSRPVCVEQIV